MNCHVAIFFAGGETAWPAAVRAVLGLPKSGKCSLLLFTHGRRSPKVVKEVQQLYFWPCSCVLPPGLCRRD